MNDLRRFNFSSNITLVNPWKGQRTSQTDLFRMQAGKVGTQVVYFYECDNIHMPNYYLQVRECYFVY